MMCINSLNKLQSRYCPCNSRCIFPGSRVALPGGVHVPGGESGTESAPGHLSPSGGRAGHMWTEGEK